MKQLFVKNHMDPKGSVYLIGFRSTLTHSFLFTGGTYYQLKNLKDTCLFLYTRFTEDILTLIKLMVSAKRRSRKKKRAPSNLRSLRLKLKQKNQDIAPTKHNMCRKIFQAFTLTFILQNQGVLCQVFNYTFQKHQSVVWGFWNWHCTLNNKSVLW